MVQLEQSLTFQGECEDAIDLYVSAFDANITSLIRFDDTGAPHPASMANKIASAELSIFDMTLRMSDGYGDASAAGWPSVGIALVMPESSVRQAVAVLSGPRANWWAADVALDTSSAVEVVDPYGVLWCLAARPPLAA